MDTRKEGGSLFLWILSHCDRDQELLAAIFAITKGDPGRRKSGQHAKAETGRGQSREDQLQHHCLGHGPAVSLTHPLIPYVSQFRLSVLELVCFCNLQPRTLTASGGRVE